MYILKNSIELMNILFYLLIAAGLLVFLSQSSYPTAADIASQPEGMRSPENGRVRRSSDPNMTTRSHYTAPSGKSRARTSSVTPFMRQYSFSL